MYNILVCDVKVIMSQALGEFEGKIAKTEIDIVINEPDEDIIILAEGRHLWRVFENLINNVCKYAMKGTRVYLDIEKAEYDVVISIKNISKEPLNISSDELMGIYSK